MQLKKQHIRHQLTYQPDPRDADFAPEGVKRSPKDYNQTNNHGKSRKQDKETQPRRRPARYTPRERFSLECARGTPKFNSKGEIVGSDGELPSIKSYNSQVSTGLLAGSIMSPKIGTNW